MTLPQKIFLIDGSAFLYRAFHAIRNLSTSKGKPTNATFGFARILLKLFKENTPVHAAVLFDVKGPTFRHKMYDQYKANRPPMPEELAAQIPDIKRLIRALNIPIMEKQGYEADDLAGTYARLAEEEGFDVVMVTGDKDFIQLVTERCTLWDPMKDTLQDVGRIKAEMGIEPRQFIDVLGLAGDTSDNIPGVAGVGPKTATELIAKFGSIETLYDNLDSLKTKRKLHENLSRSRDLVLLSRRLATIDRFVPVTETMEDFRLIPYNTQEAFALFQELEFNTLMAEFAKKPDPSEKIYKLITNLRELEKLAHVLENKGIFALDTETTSKDPTRAGLVGISFSYMENQGFYIPVGHTSPGEEEQPAKE
ncbi:MAG: DNA polymerase I, partial [Desulfobacteraceae bacterium]|nr:DNA polymerase I [Desulfobacteraceae bacterium]